MNRVTVWVFVCATLWARTALAAPTPQQNCDNARITAWKVYTSCVDAVVAKDAKGVVFDPWKAFWKCRHAYFKKWTAFQPKAALAGSTCIGPRFTSTDSGATVTDGLTGVVWETKTNDASVHDASNKYTWSTGAPWEENGTVFATFLSTLNQTTSGVCSGTTPPGQACTSDGDCLTTSNGSCVTGFAGANGWRLPTFAELQTILFDYACTGAGGSGTCICTAACVDSGFAGLDPSTQSFPYWSATSYVPDPKFAWVAGFSFGNVFGPPKTNNNYVRAVRGGL